jgi:hypothetical protein
MDRRHSIDAAIDRRDGTRTLPLFSRRVEKAPWKLDACIVDEDVEPAKAIRRRSNQPLLILNLRAICPDEVKKGLPRDPDLTPARKRIKKAAKKPRAGPALTPSTHTEERSSCL